MLGGHIAVVTPLPVLKESGTPTTISPCSTASSAAVASSLLQQQDCQTAAVERPAGTTMITFSCEKRLFPKNQIMAASSSSPATAVGGGYVPAVANDESEALFYNSRTNL